jgi:hypothetical protein
MEPGLSGGKVAGAWRWPPTPSSAEVKERVQIYLSVFVACYRVNFTFTLPLPLLVWPRGLDKDDFISLVMMPIWMASTAVNQRENVASVEVQFTRLDRSTNETMKINLQIFKIIRSAKWQASNCRVMPFRDSSNLGPKQDISYLCRVPAWKTYDLASGNPGQCWSVINNTQCRK